MSPDVTRSPLLPIAAAFAAGIGAASHFYLTAGEQIALITISTVAAGLLIWARRHSAAALACWLGFFLCGTFFAAAEHAYLPANHLERLAREGRIEPQKPAQLIGWARAPSQQRPGSETFDLEVTEIRQSGQSLPASGGLRIYYFPEPKHPPSLGVRYGTRLSLSLDNLRRPRNFLTPGSFDWQSYMRRQGISFTGRVRGPQDVAVLAGRAGSWWRAAVYRLRGRLLANLDGLYSENAGRSEEGAILKAMLLGDDNWLSPNLERAFQASGSYHVLVVSGWNVFAFAIPLLWLVTRLRLPEWLGSGLVAIAVGVFALLAEGGSSVSRAALMFLLYLLARHFYRERASLNSVAAAALILLVIQPSNLWDGGFQLSFFAVLVVIAVAVPILNWITTPYRCALGHLQDRDADPALEPRQVQFRQDCRLLLDYLCGPGSESSRGRRRMRASLGWCGYGLAWLAEAVLFTALVQASLVLVTALYFHRLTWSGILANLAILPMASAIVLIGLPLLFLALLWWRAASFVAISLGWATGALKWVAEHAARWEALNRRVPAPPAWLTFVFFALLIGLAVLVARRSRWTWVAAAALAALGVTVSVAPYPAQLSPGRLELSVLDVGQGDSLFLSFPDGATMLIDAGGEIPVPGSPPPRQDIGESVVSSYLWSRKIQKLDYVVLTHDHWDHMGGLESVLRNFRVGELWLGTDAGDRNMDWLRTIAAIRGTRNVQITEGMQKTIDGVEVHALLPSADWAPRRVSNNDSIVLRLGWKGRHILLPGDVEKRMERRLAEGSEPLTSDVLKVAHHGSRTSSTPAFLSRVQPRFGIISVGAFGRFGHPNQEVLDALRAARVRTYRTDRDGTTTISTNGHRLEVSTYRETLRPWPRFAATASH